MAKQQGPSPKKGVPAKESNNEGVEKNAEPIIPATIGIGMPINEAEMKKIKKKAKKL